MSVTPILDQLRATTAFLNVIAADRAVLDGIAPEDRRRFLQAIALVYSPDRVERRRMAKIAARERKAERVKQVQSLRTETGIQVLRRKPVFHSPNVFPPEAPQDNWSDPAAEERQHCYICKKKYTEIHHFYDQMCSSCASLNFTKRTELADLRGRVALITGARVKIGYQAALKLLRSGAHVIATTRFPRNAATRYAAEPDFGEWMGRLDVYGLDLRHSPSVEGFCREVATTRPRLDFIINNACQTVRRPPAFYAHMLEASLAAWRTCLPPAPLRSRARRRRPTTASSFPQGLLDQDLQQIDLRDRNSWRLLLHEVSTSKCWKCSSSMRLRRSSSTPG